MWITAAALRLLDVASEASPEGEGAKDRHAGKRVPDCESELKENMKAEILREDAVWLRHMVNISKKGTGSQV